LRRLQQQLSRKSLVVGVVESALEAMAQRLVDAPQFANGRDVETWAKRIANKTKGDLVSKSTVQEALESMLADKRPRSTTPSVKVEPQGRSATALASAQESHWTFELLV